MNRIQSVMLSLLGMFAFGGILEVSASDNAALGSFRDLQPYSDTILVGNITNITKEAIQIKISQILLGAQKKTDDISILKEEKYDFSPDCKTGATIIVFGKLSKKGIVSSLGELGVIVSPSEDLIKYYTGFVAVTAEGRNRVDTINYLLENTNNRDPRVKIETGWDLRNLLLQTEKGKRHTLLSEEQKVKLISCIVNKVKHLQSLDQAALDQLRYLLCTGELAYADNKEIRSAMWTVANSKVEKTKSIAQEALVLLSKLPQADESDAFIGFSKSDKEEMACIAIYALGRMRNESSIRRLREILNGDASENMKKAAANNLIER